MVEDYTESLCRELMNLYLRWAPLKTKIKVLHLLL